MALLNRFSHLIYLKPNYRCIPKAKYISQNSENSAGGVLNYNELKYESKVPAKPTMMAQTAADNNVDLDKSSIDAGSVQLLERLALVNLDNEMAFKKLQDSIEFAAKIPLIDTTGIQPLYCVLESQQLHLRTDEVNDGNCCDEIVKNATLSEEQYFVAPPGNIPLEQNGTGEKS